MTRNSFIQFRFLTPLISLYSLALLEACGPAPSAQVYSKAKTTEPSNRPSADDDREPSQGATCPIENSEFAVTVVDDFNPADVIQPAGLTHGEEVSNVLSRTSEIPLSEIRQVNAPFRLSLPTVGANGYEAGTSKNMAEYIGAVANTLARIVDDPNDSTRVISMSQGDDPVRVAISNAGTDANGNIQTIANGFKTRLGLPTTSTQFDAVQALLDQSYQAMKSQEVLDVQKRLENVVKRANEKGIVLVLSNENGQHVAENIRKQGFNLPRDATSNVLANVYSINVGASDHGNPSYFSAATPGLATLSINGVDVPVQQQGTVTESGTSQATPQVSGLVAKMLQTNHCLTPSNIKLILTSTAKAIPGGSEDIYGAGDVDEAAAIAAAKQGANP